MDKLLELQQKAIATHNNKLLKEINTQIFKLKEEDRKNKHKKLEENYNNILHDKITSFLTR